MLDYILPCQSGPGQARIILWHVVDTTVMVLLRTGLNGSCFVFLKPFNLSIVDVEYYIGFISFMRTI